MTHPGSDTPCDCLDWLDAHPTYSWNWCGSKNCVVIGWVDEDEAEAAAEEDAA